MAGELDPITLDANYSAEAKKVFRAGEYVQLKAEMLGGDWAAVQNSLGRVKQGGQDQEAGVAEIALHLGDIMTTLLQRMIVGWNLQRRIKQADGSVVWVALPFSAANVASMRKTVFDFTYQTANKLYQEEEDASQTDFTNSAAEPIVASS